MYPGPIPCADSCDGGRASGLGIGRNDTAWTGRNHVYLADVSFGSTFKFGSGYCNSADTDPRDHDHIK